MEKINIDKNFLYEEYVINKKSSTDIAELIGCTRATIIRHLRIDNIPIRSIKEALGVSNKVFSERKYLNILTKNFLEKEYLENKKTMVKIGEIIGCNSCVISNYLKLYNIPTLSYKEAQRYNGKIIPCEICGTEKYFAQWEQDCRKHFYCSQKCRYEGMSLFYSGKNGSNYQGGKIEVKCSFCYKTLLRDKCQLNDTNRYYCDKECMAQYFSENIFGKNHPNFGRKFPEFSKRMKENNPMRDERNRKKVSKTLKRLFKEGTWSARKGTYHTIESRLKQSLAKGGNGIDLADPRYPGIFGKALKQRIKDRDNHVCRCCFQTEEQEIKDTGRGLSVHHIDYNKFNCVDNNLITACLSCNNVANSNRDYWYTYYMYIIENYIKEK